MSGNNTERMGNAWFFPPPGQWKAIHFYNLPETTRPIELDQGHLVLSPPPGIHHQVAVKALYGLLSKHARVYNTGRAYSSVMPLQISETIVRKPDVMFVERGNHAIRDDFCITGAPDWIAEVIDSETRTVDCGDKMHEYARIGVPEYWIVDPDKHAVSRYQLQSGRFRHEGDFYAGQVIESFAIDHFRVTISELF